MKKLFTIIAMAWIAAGAYAQVIIAEKDWTGCTTDDLLWYQFADGQEGTVEATDEGIAITNYEVYSVIWQPQTMVLDGVSLEAGRTYIVRITAKIPHDGKIQVNMDHWEGKDDDVGPWEQYTVNVSGSNKFQTIEVEFPNYPYTSDGDAHVLFQNGFIVGTCVVKKVEIIDLYAKPTAVTITANNYVRGYGDNNPSFGYTTSGGTLNGTPKITCSATKTSPVGTYPIKIERGSVTNNNVTYVNGTLTITKAPLTITAKSYTREEGQENPAFDVTYSGFKNNETSTVLTQKPIVSTTATKDSPVGTYDIKVYGAKAQNYSFTYVNGTLTVTEKEKVSFSKDGITYFGNNSTRMAKVQSVDNDLMDLEIPSSVSYNGRTYQVKSIDNGVLSNRTFNYVSLPSTITILNAGTFSNSTLGALIWNANASLSSNVFSSMAISTSSNFLLYVNSKSYAPSNVSNVVVGTSASSITLADGTNTMFYCPKAFTAQSISYTHNYSMKTGGSGMGWETIALPFDVQRIEHETKGKITPFAAYNGSGSQRPFWLYELGSNGFRRTDGIKANRPYIISMPNNSSYNDDYILAGDVTFSATNARVAETKSFTKSSSNGKTFVPAFTVVNPASTVYALNVVNQLVSNSGSYDPGSRFIRNLDVYPFEGYMTSSSGTRTLSIVFDDGTTGMDNMPLAVRSTGRVKVYSLSGQLLIDTTQPDFDPHWQQLPSGVYIVNGQKRLK